MSYLGELRHNLRPLAAACLGTGTSLPLFAYTNSVFSPYLLKQFGWSRAQFALVGLTMMATLVVLPFVGRFTDRFGERRGGLVGARDGALRIVVLSPHRGRCALSAMPFSKAALRISWQCPPRFSWSAR